MYLMLGERHDTSSSCKVSCNSDMMTTTLIVKDSSVGRAADWHSTDGGLIPECSKGFCSQSFNADS